jgi:hypothetical protein
LAEQFFDRQALLAFDGFGHGGYEGAGEAVVGGLLDVAQVADFPRRDEGYGEAGLAGAAGAADAVDIAVGGLGDVEVVDVGYAADVEAAGGDVGGDEDVDGAFAKLAGTISRLLWVRSPWMPSAR